MTAPTSLTDAVLALRDTRLGDFWRCEAGPGLAAAALHHAQWKRTPGLGAPGSVLPAIAVRAFHRLVTEHQATQYQATDGNITAGFFAEALGQAILILRRTSNLAPAEDQLWTTALVSIASKLVADHELAWYANGNICLGNTLVMALTHQVTGDPQWAALTDRAFAQTVTPDPVRWPGKGLVLDGDAGYLVETGAYGSGFDTDYAIVSLSQATRWWLMTRDPRALTLLRQLWAKLSPLVDAAGTIDMTAGTRHPHPGARWDLISCAVPVVAANGDAQAQALLPGYWAKMLDPNRYPATMNSTGYYSLGSNTGTALLALAGWTPTT